MSTPNTGNPWDVPTLVLHDLCKIIPAHTEKELKDLVEDIRKNKLQHPVMIYEGKILDGRGRYNACLELAKERIDTGFRTETYTGPDPRRYVVSANVKRRHLNESQRALIATQLANFTWGGDRSKTPIEVLTRVDAAALLNVGKTSVERANNVLKNAAPAVVEAVRTGKVKVSAAENFSKSDKQDELIAQYKGDVVEAVKNLPKPTKVPKRISPEAERKARKQAIDDLKFRWSTEFTIWQKRYFVKQFRDEITEILEHFEEWEGEIEKTEAEVAEAVAKALPVGSVPPPPADAAAAAIAASAKAAAAPPPGLNRRPMGT